MSSDAEPVLTCGCFTLIVAVYAIFGELSVNFLLDVFLNHTLPLGWAIFTGLFVGEFTIPAAIAVWVLRLFHIL